MFFLMVKYFCTMLYISGTHRFMLLCHAKTNLTAQQADLKTVFKWEIIFPAACLSTVDLSLLLVSSVVSLVT